MGNQTLVLIFFVIIPVVVFLITTIVLYVKTPFKFPYWRMSFNVSGVKQPKMVDYIDQYLIDYGMEAIEEHLIQVGVWRESCLKKIQKSLFKKRRKIQFKNCLNYQGLYVFSFIRYQTRYKQANYVRHPYTVIQTTEVRGCPYDYLLERFNLLKSINFEAILSVYYSKKQRSLMTKELRERIAFRDNYTCQICGKYMPDGVGLHIDHIIPVSRGGKSIPSNLQVLCSKCNGKKSKN